MSNLLLASEATTQLDFGEGTKVRIGNVTVRLKGIYFRTDDKHIEALMKTNAWYKEHAAQVDMLCDIATIEKHPYDRGQNNKARVTNLVNRYTQNLKVMESLGEKISQRDTTIRELTKNVEYLKKELRNRIKILRDAITSLATQMADAQMEKPDVC